jgi:hypothetical protein
MTKKWLVPFGVLLPFLVSTCDSSSGPSPVVEAALTLLPASGDTDTEFTFNAGASSSTKKNPSMEYQWDFDGDGTWDQTWSSPSSATHSYSSPGTYTPRVEVRDGQVADQASASVDVAPVVVAMLEVSPETGTILTEFEFDASASTSSSPGMGNLEFRWDLDDDGTYETPWSSEPTRTTRMAGAGNPGVRVQVRDGSGLDDAFTSVTMNLNHGTVVDSLVFGKDIRASGLTYDGQHFWISQWGPDETLVQVDGQTGATLESFPAHSNWTGGLAWVENSLWQTSFGAGPIFVQLDPSNGTVQSSFPVIYSRGRSGLCWDGEGFFFGSRKSAGGGDNKIHRYDSSGTELAILDIPAGTAEPHGLTCDGETLWFVDEDVDNIFQLDPATGAVVNTLPRWGNPPLTIAEGYLWTFSSRPDYGVLFKIVP